MNQSRDDMKPEEVARLEAIDRKVWDAYVAYNKQKGIVIQQPSKNKPSRWLADEWSRLGCPHEPACWLCEPVEFGHHPEWL